MSDSSEQLKRVAGTATAGDAKRLRLSNPPPYTVETFVSQHQRTFPSLSGKENLLQRARSEHLFRYKLAVASVIQDLQVYRVKVLPGFGTDTLTVVRDPRHEIIAIRDESQELSGPALGRLMINYGASLSGFAMVVYKMKLSEPRHTSEGLLIPVLNMTEYFINKEEVGAEFPTNDGMTVYLRNQVFHLIIPASDARHLMALESLTITQWPALLRAVSDLRKVDLTYDITGLRSLDDVIGAKAQPDLKRGALAFLECLEASFLSAATIQEKVDAFCRTPSCQFLVRLQLKRPFSRQLFHADGSAVKKVALASVASEGEILLQELPYDGAYYERSLTTAMPVYVKGDYFVKSGKARKPLKTVGTMKANDLLRIVAAKNRSSQTQPSEGAPSLEADPEPDNDHRAAYTLDI